MSKEEKEVLKDEQDGKENKSQNKTNTKSSRSRKQAGNETVQKTKSTDENSKRVQSDKESVVIPCNPNPKDYKKKKEEVDITPYVSNVEGSVYAISGLPEEFIATLFAWVSRSSKSFKEHLRTALKDQDVRGSLDSFQELDEKAKKFHEKWTVGFGHSSVAEHAVAHVGIEGISRLASAELELANTFLSITEYSQRYQKPERGKWHNPFEYDVNDVESVSKEQLARHQEVEEFFHASFNAFETLIKGVHRHLLAQHTDQDGILTVSSNDLLKLAFEDARYVLPLAMHTQLGMTANGRAWRDALAVLGNSDHAESKKLAEDLRTEITKVLPVLLKYATPSQYQTNAHKRMKHLLSHPNIGFTPAQKVQLQTVQVEEEVIQHVVALLKTEYENMPYAHALSYVQHAMTPEARRKVIQELLYEMKHFDTAPEVFKHVTYDATLLVSEANWHQLLRHNRKTNFTATSPSPHFGMTIPPRIVEAGLQDIMKGIAAQSKELYNKLVEEGLEKEAEYVVLNAHQRPIYMTFNLWEAYHLINLRTSEEAQWDIRDTFEELYKQLQVVHPLLVSQAQRRL